MLIFFEMTNLHTSKIPDCPSIHFGFACTHTQCSRQVLVQALRDPDASGLPASNELVRHLVPEDQGPRCPLGIGRQPALPEQRDGILP